jgi:hypothetical protein
VTWADLVIAIRDHVRVEVLDIGPSPEKMCKREKGLWKADADGGQPVELVSPTYFPNYPIVTPDRHVVFTSSQGGLQAPWIVSLDGGPPRGRMSGLRPEAVERYPCRRRRTFAKYES